MSLGLPNDLRTRAVALAIGLCIWGAARKSVVALPSAFLRQAGASGMMVKVDVDGRTRLPLLELVQRARRANVELVALGERRSPSGRGWHQWLVVNPLPRSAIRTVALQLLFGSDPYREAYLLQRARIVDTKQCSPFFRSRWNVFYLRTYRRRTRG